MEEANCMHLDPRLVRTRRVRMLTSEIPAIYLSTNQSENVHEMKLSLIPSLKPPLWKLSRSSGLLSMNCLFSLLGPTFSFGYSLIPCNKICFLFVYGTKRKQNGREQGREIHWQYEAFCLPNAWSGDNWWFPMGSVVMNSSWAWETWLDPTEEHQAAGDGTVGWQWQGWGRGRNVPWSEFPH